MRLIVPLALAAASCSSAKMGTAPDAHAATPPSAPGRAGPAPVRTARTRALKRARRERYVGELVAKGIVEIKPTTGGRIAQVLKRLGDRVRQGEVVVVMDDEELTKRIAEARVAAEVARAQVKRGEIDLARNELELERARRLYERKVIPDRDMDNVKAATDLSRATLQLSRVQVQQAEARLETLGVQLRNTRIKSPFAGRVNARLLEPGAVIVAMNPAPILQIVTSQDVRARFKVPEAHLGEIPLGKEVTVEVEAFPGEKFRGKVTRLAAALDPVTRSVLAEARIKNPKGRLKPGMFIRATVLWSSEVSVVLAPVRALVRPPEGSGDAALFLFDGGRAKRVPVQAGRERGDEVEVRGVPPGAEVIVEGHEELKDGTPVALAAAPRGGAR